MQHFWNDRYGQSEYIYGKKPNAFLALQLQHLPPGYILFPAEGEGRNAVYAASIGWKVEAFDYSSSGKEKALKMADEMGVQIHYNVQDAMEFEPRPNHFDAIALVFTHFPPAIRQVLFPRLVASLKPGGRIIMECFHIRQLEYQKQYQSGGPGTAELLYTEAQIPEFFSELHTELLESREVELMEGAYHNGPAFVVQYVGIR